MTCPNCGKETSATFVKPITESQFCPNCGTLIRLAAPQKEERNPPSPPPVAAQKQIPKPAPPPLTTTPISPGPLLTGWMALDTAIGFMEEIVAVALIIYAFVVFGSSGPGAALAHAALVAGGAVITAFLLLWHASTMRKRYPSFARGWERSRYIWGKGLDHIATLCFGVLMLAMLFPLGGLLICLGMNFGPIAWVGALIIAYLFGILARRMTGTGKGNKKP